jgi:phosphatidylglycerol:prolipoprotein diacylglycerol transferase
MRPILLELGGVTIYSYGTALALTALVGALLAWYRRPPGLFTLEQFSTICMLAAVGASLGSRLAYLLLQGDLAAESLAGSLRLWERSGLASLGVPAVLVPALIVYFRRQRIPVVTAFDYLIPFAVFGAAMQRTFGCFLAGCCSGKPTALPWGVTFPGSDHALHPTQLYLGAILFALFIALARWRPARPGAKGFGAVGAYAAVSLTINPLRADLGADLMSTQGAYLVLLMICAAASWRLRRQRPATRIPATPFIKEART